MHHSVYTFYIMLNVSELKEYKFFEMFCNSVKASWLGNQWQNIIAAPGRWYLIRFWVNPKVQCPVKRRGKKRWMKSEKGRSFYIFYSTFKKF